MGYNPSNAGFISAPYKYNKTITVKKMPKKVISTEKPDLSLPLNMNVIGDFVRYKRTSLGITLEDAAALCDLSKQAYNNIEKGIENSRVDTLFKVLSALGIRLEIKDEVSDDGWI